MHAMWESSIFSTAQLPQNQPGFQLLRVPATNLLPRSTTSASLSHTIERLGRLLGPQTRRDQLREQQYELRTNLSLALVLPILPDLNLLPSFELMVTNPRLRVDLGQLLVPRRRSHSALALLSSLSDRLAQRSKEKQRIETKHLGSPSLAMLVVLLSRSRVDWDFLDLPRAQRTKWLGDESSRRELEESNRCRNNGRAMRRDKLNGSGLDL